MSAGDNAGRPRVPRARFIVVEGLDGVGKSTASRLLAQALDAVHLSTPDDELTAARALLEPLLDGHADARTLWYAASVVRASDRVRACLAAGDAVVVDRYFLSTLAYAELRGSRLRLGEVAALLAIPDVTLYLRAPRATRAERMRARRANSAEDARTLAADADDLLDAAFRRHRALPIAGRFVPVDTDGRSPDEVVSAVLAELAQPAQPVAHARTLPAPPMVRVRRVLSGERA